MTVNELIERMVAESYGHADLRTQHMYRTQLGILVEMAKSELRKEYDIQAGDDPRRASRGTMH